MDTYLTTVVSNEKIADKIFRIELHGDIVCEMNTPGQFVNIKVNNGYEFLLRRPISICEINKDKNTFVMIYRADGAGTIKIPELEPGDLVDVLGPLGKGYDISSLEKGQTALLVGGGIGVPPLYELAKQFRNVGINTIHILGFNNKKDVFLYSLFVILSGSVASVLMDIDKFMLNQYLPIGEIAVYNVAIFTATVIAIPYRSMYQIVSPMTAQFMNQSKSKELLDLYKRSTVNTYFVSMVICVLIIVNAQQYYALLPNKDYSTGLVVLMIISVVKLSDALVGFSNAVLLNSPYYRTVLFLGVFLVIGTILMNMWLIPLYGIKGAGLATLLAFTSYNLLKSGFVYRKYGLQPFYKETLLTTLFGIVTVGGFFFWDFAFHPLINIGLKSLLVGGISIFFLLKFKLSEELVKLIVR